MVKRTTGKVTMNTQEKPSFSWAQLQLEQKPWVLHNFGDRPATQPLRGIIEEIGEFVDAKTSEDKLDACADLVIFACDYCSGKGWNFSEVMEITPDVIGNELSQNFLLSQIGKLCHADLKSEQKIRTNQNHENDAKKALRNIIKVFDLIVIDHNFSLIGVVEETWSKVKLRNWKKDSVNAGEVK